MLIYFYFYDYNFPIYTYQKLCKNNNFLQIFTNSSHMIVQILLR